MPALNFCHLTTPPPTPYNPPHAGIAQLVERNLAKVEVASSNLVSRSRFLYGRTGAEWQSGYAAACKAVYAGSIPTSASTPARVAER